MKLCCLYICMKCKVVLLYILSDVVLIYVVYVIHCVVYDIRCV